jgi:hypothetical protein
MNAFTSVKRNFLVAKKKLWIKGGGARWKKNNRTFDNHAERTTNDLQKSGKNQPTNQQSNNFIRK